MWYQSSFENMILKIRNDKDKIYPKALIINIMLNYAFWKLCLMVLAFSAASVSSLPGAMETKLK